MDIKYVLEQYFDKNRSVDELAEELGTYPNKIARAIKKTGKKLRTKSESQKLALENGRTAHPTEGKKIPKQTKDKMSKSLMKNWEEMDEETREKRIEGYKERYKNMSDESKEKLQEAAIAGLLKSAKEGSKIEHFIMDQLKNSGYEVVFHKKGLIPNDKLEVDIFIPSLKTAIEIDGFGHFEAVWGEDKLKKRQDSDNHKNGLLAAYGYKIIRVKYKFKNFGKIAQNKTKECVMNAIDEIKANKVNFLEVEVNG
jgi:very-short-patch-repair endonuclease